MFRWHKHVEEQTDTVPETAKEYEIAVNDIKITAQFESTRPGKRKWGNKMAYYEATGGFMNPCVLVPDNTLVDGYCTYLLAKKLGLETVTCIYIGDNWRPMDGANIHTA